MLDEKRYLEKYSNFGRYSITDELALSLPYTSISFKKESEKKFSYNRIDSQNSGCSKVITTKNAKPEIMFVPIAPNHQPSNEADHIFQRFWTGIIILLIEVCLSRWFIISRVIFA